MVNLFYIPEIVGHVFSFLEPKELAKASQVSKTWRLEARKKLYENQSVIIYDLLKGGLNDLRHKSLAITLPEDRYLLKSIQRFEKFSFTFGLDEKVELLAIRKRLGKTHKNSKKRYKKWDKRVLIANAEMDRKETIYNTLEGKFKSSYGINVFDPAVDDWNYARTQQYEADECRFQAFRNLVNFEYFTLMVIPFAFTEEEKDIILEKVQDLNEEEYERINDSDILDYWGDEDPDE